jgi:hypothetical protein
LGHLFDGQERAAAHPCMQHREIKMPLKLDSLQVLGQAVYESYILLSALCTSG